MSDQEILDILEQLLKTGKFYVEFRQPVPGNSKTQQWMPLRGQQSGFMALLDYQQRISNPAGPDTEYRLIVTTSEPIVVKLYIPEADDE